MTPAPPCKEVAFAGNPNTGKSTLFNALTGSRQHTGNWPGKTVDLAYGVFKTDGARYTAVDLPGAYSLWPSSAEEAVARDYLLHSAPAATVVVADAGCLERNLNLLLQITAFTSRVVLCVNMIDEAQAQGIEVDAGPLSQELGIPVVLTAARSGAGLDRLKAVIRAVAEGDLQPTPTAMEVGCGPAGADEAIVAAIYARARAIVDKCVRSDAEAEAVGEDAGASASLASGARTVAAPAAANRRSRTELLDDILTSRVFGLPIILAMLGLVLWITVVGANYPSGVLAAALFRLEGHLGALFAWAGVPAWLKGALLDGGYRTLAWVVSVMLPPMAIFFPLFALLEDTGYLARVSFNLDALFKASGGHGKQALTMAMGFGCNAAGVMACRIIDSPRERLIAIITNNFAVCNGRFPTLIALASFMTLGIAGGRALSSASLVVVGMVLIGVAATFGVSWLLSKTLLRGVPSSFVLELPPYRRPDTIRVIGRTIRDRIFVVLKRAMVVAGPAGVVVWALANITLGDRSIIAHLAAALDPAGRAMGMDGAVLTAFVLGLPANEIVMPILTMVYLAGSRLTEISSLETMAGVLAANGWTATTALCTTVFAVLHFPCSTTLMTIARETGSPKWTAIAALLPTAVAVGVCAALAAVLR